MRNRRKASAEVQALPENERKPRMVDFSSKNRFWGSELRNTKVVVKAVEEKPVDTFSITSLAATSANELTATFATAVASEGAVTIKVNKAGSTTAIDGKVTWSEDLTTAKFTATAKLVAGTYEMTATDVADKTKTATATAVVENEKVAEIKILNDVALTGDSAPNAATPKVRDLAYIYYDVVNQYGESLKNSASITWTVSSDQNPQINKAAGRITAKTTATGGYVYGSSIYVTGVYNKTGVTVQKELKIGMTQNLDTVKSCGFLKMTDKNTILDKLPANFQSGQYVLLYQAFDQNGNQLANSHNGAEMNTGETGSPAVTFISDNVLLVKNTFKDAPDYTIDGVEYNAVYIEPGQYVDKGGEVNITAIANNTGNKTTMNYIIGAAGLLKSVVLSQPAEVVADGEEHEIPFVAYDVDGKEIKNYEAIARTTNTLNLTASEGTLRVEEKADGTAKFVFKDRAVDWSDGSTHDDVSRSVALTTVVVGGESNNMILSVDDKARPVAVKDVTFRKDATTVVIEDDTNTIDYTRFTFVDQYGRVMSRNLDGTNNSNGFFEYISKNGGQSWNNKWFAIKAEFNKAGSLFNIATPSGVTTEARINGNNVAVIENTKGAITWTAKFSGEVKNETIKWTVDSYENSSRPADIEKYDYCDKTYAVSYSVIPMAKASNIAINALEKQYINLGLGDYKTGAEASLSATNMLDNLSANKGSFKTASVEVKNNYRQTIGVSAAYQGTKVVVPATYVEYTSEKLAVVPDSYSGDTGVVTAGAIIGVSTGALKLGDFFDATTANFVRKDGKASVTARVYSKTAGAVERRSSQVSSVSEADLKDGTFDKEVKDSGWTVDSAASIQLAAPSIDVVFSDANPAATKIELVGESCTVTPMLTAIADSAVTVTAIDNTNYLSNVYLTLPDAGLTKHNKAFDSTKACKQSPRVFDQYGKVMSVNASDWTYTISDIVENTNELAHLDKSFTVTANATSAPVITGAEVGDTFTLTYKVKNASASLKVTVGADGYAKITSGAGGDYDKFLRKNFLYCAY